jgi:hypothetical protein
MPEKNHYLPIFYQKRWAGTDGRICRYSRPFKKVEALRKHPRAVGCELDLYTVPGSGPDAISYLEREFFRETDDTAAQALALIEAGRIKDMNNRLLSGWTRFVMSLIYRTPQEIRTLFRETVTHSLHAERKFEENYENERLPDDPPTFAEFREKDSGGYTNQYGRAGIRLVQSLIDNKAVGDLLMREMRWSTIELQGSYTFLTCDRPIVMTNGLVKPGAHIGLPIGPRRLFVAAASLDFLKPLNNNSDALAKLVNDRIASQAREFCIGTNDTHLRFVERRLGTRDPSTPFDNMKFVTPEELDARKAR